MDNKIPTNMDELRDHVKAQMDARIKELGWEEFERQMRESEEKRQAELKALDNPGSDA